MLRDPDKMTMEEREKEIAHLLGKGLLRRHRFNKRMGSCKPGEAGPSGTPRNNKIKAQKEAAG